MLSAWWVWAVAGILLLIAEAFTAGAILLGFGLGALIIAIVLLVGGPVAAALAGSVPLMLLCFAVLSLISWIVMRRVLGVRKGQVKVWTRDINED
ncbi:NfeD family protein [Pontivivens insulae]|uniref:NfeD-like C-terminal domain-containing protein n=1 Tax=Pontivivens insulae TaxID=1639689 RepID=A0A2R8AC59_9RHOB|nr:hypothetical protein [Pontivivens insulae]RED11176.1 hypothetical protein DFR53_3206 [Pontivivens insulae]SPF29650.1 hypothetical protein POI8812_01966 [Pontivivens insulae]